MKKKEKKKQGPQQEFLTKINCMTSKNCEKLTISYTNINTLASIIGK